MPRAIRVCAFAVLAALSGCGSELRSYIASQSVARTQWQGPVSAQDSCELRLYVEQRVPERRDAVRLVAVEVDQTYKAATEGICIKRRGEPLAFPAPIFLAGQFSDTDRRRFCIGGTLRGKVQLAPHDTSAFCVWNGVYHAARPFTFTFVRAKDRPGAALSDSIAAVRIYRNGKLAFAWSSVAPQDRTPVLLVPGRSVVVAQTFLAAEMPPHNADFDLRIWPANRDVPISLLEEQVRDASALRTAKLDSLLAAAQLSLDTADLGLLSGARCLAAQVEVSWTHLMAPFDRTLVSPPLPAGCAPLAPTALPTAYDLAAALKDGELIAKLEASYSGNVEAAVAAFLGSTPSADKKRMAAALSAEARVLLEEARRLRDRARASLKELARDREQQARIYEVAVSELAKGPAPFESRVENPPIDPASSALSMKYGDKFQGYWLSPWFGLPVRASGVRGTDFNASLAIPILDVVGARYQWNESRLAEIRAAFGLMYFQDAERKPSATAEAEQATEVHEPWEFALQGNLSIGTYRVGLAVIPTHRQDFEHGHGERRLRILIGADLLKLFSGRNIEAF